MDLPPQKLQFISIPNILRESTSIPKQSPKTFYLLTLTLTLIFPLSFLILVHSLFTYPLFTQIDSPTGSHSSQWTKLFIFQFFYLIFLFAFSLLSTVAVVFTVASLYTSKPVSFSSTIDTISRIFRRVFITYLWISLIMIIYNIVFIDFLLVIAVDTQNPILLFFSMVVIFIMFLVVHVYTTALWHLASVVSVLELVFRFATMENSYKLLKRMTRMAIVLLCGYLAIYGVNNGVFGAIVVHGEGYGIFVRIMVGRFLVGVMVIVNLVGLMVQSVLYYVCKSYHHQGIDKSALYDHLGGYLGEYVLINSNIQMKTLMFEAMVR